MKLKLPKKKPFRDALKINRWLMNWFDDKKERKEKRQEKISKLYPKKMNNKYIFDVDGTLTPSDNRLIMILKDTCLTFLIKKMSILSQVVIEKKL